MGQLSFFSAGARPAAPEDLEGLLCGPAQVVRRRDAARVSVVVTDGWRVEALLRALAAAGFPGEAADAHEDATTVRTAFDPLLVPLATRWNAGPDKRPPHNLVLDGPRLRWWALAAGRHDALGYVLGLGPQDASAWPGVGAALARSGLPATFLGPRADGPAYRLTGQRRLARFAELVGDRPDGAPDDAWPS